jgi:hypothetical protein
MFKVKRCPLCCGRKTIDVWEEVARSEISVTAERREKICPTCNGTGEVSVTNADRIRAMSDKELLDIFRYRGCPPDRLTGECVKVGVCEACWVDWLKQPAKEVSNDTT